MIFVLAQYQIKPGKLVQAKKLVKEYVKAVKKNEPGTKNYAAFQLQDDKTVFVHYMEFQNLEAKLRHTQTDHVKKFADKIYPLCEIEPVFNELSQID